MTLYAVGLDNDKTLARFVAQAIASGEEVRLVNLHTVARGSWRFAIPATAGGALTCRGEETVELDPSASYFVRLVDLSPVLPEPASGGWRAMIAAFAGFLETATGRVVNRPGAHAHNGAKPLHESWLIRHGFRVPASITTSVPDEARSFVRTHGDAILKPLSGVRATAQVVTEADLAAFEAEQGPIHLQRYIPGHDVRVHVIGGEMFAEAIRCESVDYRASGADTVHVPTTVPSDLACMMRRAATRMGLAFTGWDYKVDADGRYWCLEANPMPGYDVYDRRADGVISAALVRYLVGAEQRE